MNDANPTTAIHEVASTYVSDIEPDVVIHELEILRALAFVKDCHDIRDLLQEFYNRNAAPAYPNLTTLLRICLTLPFTSASCERTFSKVEFVKSNLRSTMSQDRLFNLMVASVESDIAETVPSDSLIDDFARQQDRRMVLY